MSTPNGEGEVDPWKRAQEGAFSISASGPTTPQAPSLQTPLSPPGRVARPTYEEPSITKPPSRRVKISRPIGVVAAGVLLAIFVGGIVLAIYLYVRSAGKAAVEGVSLAERIQAETTLNEATRAETAYYSVHGKYTDDIDALRREVPGIAWDKGSEPRSVGAVSVELCDSAASTLLLQTKSERGNVFALWIEGRSQSRFYALGPVSCPRLDAGGFPRSPWSRDKDAGWSPTGGSEGAPEPGDLPPVGAPRPPAIPSPYGGSSPTPYSNPARGGGGSTPGGGDSYPYPYP